MPLTGHVGLVSQLFHFLAPQLSCNSQTVQPFTGIEGSPQESARIKHRSGCDTDRPVPSSHIVGGGEYRSPPGKFVQGGSDHFPVPQIMDGVIALVVGQNEQDIRLIRFCIPGAGKQNNQRNNEQDNENIPHQITV